MGVKFHIDVEEQTFTILLELRHIMATIRRYREMIRIFHVMHARGVRPEIYCKCDDAGTLLSPRTLYKSYTMPSIRKH